MIILPESKSKTQEIILREAPHKLNEKEKSGEGVSIRDIMWVGSLAKRDINRKWYLGYGQDSCRKSHRDQKGFIFVPGLIVFVCFP